MKNFFFGLSVMFFLSEARGVSQAQFRLEFERELQASVGRWNQAQTYSQVVRQTPGTKEDKELLKNLFQREGVWFERPVPIEYNPRTKKLVFRFKEGPEPLTILSMAPVFVVQDGEDTWEYRADGTLRDSLLPMLRRRSAASWSHAPHGAKGFLWDLFVPTLQAQWMTTASPDEVAAANKRMEKKQKKGLKMVLMGALLGGAGFYVGGHLWWKFSHFLNPNWGQGGFEKRYQEKQVATSIKGKVQEHLLGDKKQRVTFVLCREPGVSSSLKELNFRLEGSQGDEKRFKFDSDTDLQKALNEKGPFARQLKLANDCCLNHPCIVDLSKALLGAGDDPFESTMGSRSEASGSGEFKTSNEEIELPPKGEEGNVQ